MRIDEIRRAQKAEPFKPFKFRTADGREFSVPHPEFLLIHPSERIVVIADPEGGFDMIDAPLVASLQIGNGKEPKSKKK